MYQHLVSQIRSVTGAIGDFSAILPAINAPEAHMTRSKALAHWKLVGYCSSLPAPVKAFLKSLPFIPSETCVLTKLLSEVPSELCQQLL